LKNELGRPVCALNRADVMGSENSKSYNEPAKGFLIYHLPLVAQPHSVWHQYAIALTKHWVGRAQGVKQLLRGRDE